MIEINKIYNEDCLIGMQNIPDKSVDCIICDLPYGITDCSWDIIIPFDKLWEQYNRVIKDNGAIVLFASQPFTTKLISSNIKNYKHIWVWNKGTCGSFALSKKRPMIITEDIVVFSSGGGVKYYPIMEDADPKNVRPICNNKKIKDNAPNPLSSGKLIYDKNYDPNKRYPKNIITHSKINAECNSRNRFHPTQKPVALIEYLIKTYTNEGELVLDNCMGSGTTAISCMNTNRNFIGFELNKEYYDIACKRIEENKMKLF